MPEELPPWARAKTSFSPNGLAAWTEELELEAVRGAGGDDVEILVVFPSEVSPFLPEYILTPITNSIIAKRAIKWWLL
jgi:hypothetical protein